MKNAVTEVMVGGSPRGSYIMQENCRDFATNLAMYLNVKHAFGVPNGTDAIIIWLKAISIAPADEIIGAARGASAGADSY